MAERAVTRSSSDTEAAASEDLNQYRIAQKQFDTAAQYVTGLAAGMCDYLRSTMRLTTVEFPIEFDDGSVKTFKDRHNASVDLRTAAFALAIKRVTDVANRRGIWP